MATNKNASIRYIALDQCFSNFGRKFYMEDLINNCNKALYEYNGTTDGVKRRQIYDDIKFMESEQGWSIPLEKIKDGRQTYYRYSDKDFSINKKPINELEATQLKEAISILTRFKGMTQFEWMEEMLYRLDASLKTTTQSQTQIVSFEHNPYLKGIEFFSDLFNAINFKRVLEIEYKSFKQFEPAKYVIHPYYLKQYNNRWFLFGYNNEVEDISNLAIDRIISVDETNIKFQENTETDFEEYFDDVIGVTISPSSEIKKILLRVNNSRLPYIESKPLHGSQIIKERGNDCTVLQLTVHINNELVSLLLSYGDDITIIEPNELKNIIKNKAKKIFESYL